MRISDLHFSDETELEYSAITPCLFKDVSETGANDYNKYVKELIKNASDTDEFVSHYLNESSAKEHGYYKSKCYQTMLKIYDNNKARDYCRTMLGRKFRTTASDASSIKIANKYVEMYFPTLSTNTYTRYGVLNKEEFYADNIMTYLSSFVSSERAKFNIYFQDSGTDNKIDKTLEPGKYSVYSFDGIVALVKLPEC